MSEKYLKFWGTRGSCPVSGPDYLHFGGNTPCLELAYENVRIIFDAGTGIRPLGQKLLNEKIKKIDLFIGHMHWDHILGFPFFDPIYQPDVTINIWGPQGKGRSCSELLTDALAPDFFPLSLSELQANLQFNVLQEQIPVQIGPITINFHTVTHPGLAYCFKIKTPHQTIGYVTDNELSNPFGKQEESLISFFKGCDILIHEAQYLPEEYDKKKGWGHSCLIGALKFIEQTKALKWLISHHDPSHTDADLEHAATLAQQACSIPCQLVRDGQVVDLL